MPVQEKANKKVDEVPEGKYIHGPIPWCVVIMIHPNKSEYALNDKKSNWPVAQCTTTGAAVGSAFQ